MLRITFKVSYLSYWRLLSSHFFCLVGRASCRSTRRPLARRRVYAPKRQQTQGVQIQDPVPRKVPRNPRVR